MASTIAPTSSRTADEALERERLREIVRLRARVAELEAESVKEERRLIAADRIPTEFGLASRWERGLIDAGDNRGAEQMRERFREARREHLTQALLRRREADHELADAQLRVIAPNIVNPSVVCHATGRAPRLATNTRSRGSRRSGRAGPSSSDDPPDESDSDELIECAARGCRNRFARRGPKRFCSEPCGASHRQDRRRYGDLSDRERDELADAIMARYAGKDAFALRAVERDPKGKLRIHSQTFLTTGGQHARLAHPGLRLRFELEPRPVELALNAGSAVEGAPEDEREALAFALRCRCNGSHINGGEVGCFKCGRSRVGAID